MLQYPHTPFMPYHSPYTNYASISSYNIYATISSYNMYSWVNNKTINDFQFDGYQDLLTQEYMLYEDIVA
jgi:hypothetical protein